MTTVLPRRPPSIRRSPLRGDHGWVDCSYLSMASAWVTGESATFYPWFPRRFPLFWTPPFECVIRNGRLGVGTPGIYVLRLGRDACMGEHTVSGETYAVDARGPKGSFIVDGRGVVLAFDLRMEELTGWHAFEIVGRHKDLAGDREGGDVAGGPVARSLYDGTIPTPTSDGPFDLRLRCRDGRVLDVEAFVKALRGAG